MKVEIWSDYVCPFCYIGKTHLEKALETFPHRDQVELEYKSYELDPLAAKDSEDSNEERMVKKYGMSAEEARKMGEGISQQGAQVGLEMNFDSLIPTNTFDAHRLTHFAKTKGKAKEMTDRLLYAYFTESKHVGDHEVLADLAAEVGLDRAESLKVLEDENAYAQDVRGDEQEAGQLGVRGVPFFVINRKYGISGAQPIEKFLESLEQVYKEEQGSGELKDLGGGNQGAACTDDSCDV